jgi:glycosyltransferase involved in cell wall biosynthesis
MAGRPPTNDSGPLLSVLMPVYNERPLVRQVVERVLGAALPERMARELIVVDDGSTDGTSDEIRRLAQQYPDAVRAFFLEQNRGKGAALRRAIPEIQGAYAIVQDADLEYDPADYPALLEPMLAGRADVVYGSRFPARSMHRSLSFGQALGNWLLTHLSNLFTGLKLTDMETGYKAFRAEVLKATPLRSDGFGFEPEITAKIARRGCRVCEVPIHYAGRTHREGKKIAFRDGLAAVYTILKFGLVDDSRLPSPLAGEGRG